MQTLQNETEKRWGSIKGLHEHTMATSETWPAYDIYVLNTNNWNEVTAASVTVRLLTESNKLRRASAHERYR